MSDLRARIELPDNADPILAVEAMEAVHARDSASLAQFALELHDLGAAQFYSVGVTTINFLTIKGMEVRTGNPNVYLKSAIDYIQNHGVEFAETYSVDANALSDEVSRYLSDTLMPILNGTENLSLDFPNDAPEHTRQYVLALTYVSYAFFITAHREVTGEADISFDELKEQIENRAALVVEGSAHKGSHHHHPLDVPQEPLETSHLGYIHRSSFHSPTHEATSKVDISIPLQLSKFYGESNKVGMQETAKDVLLGKISIEEIVKPVLHFCRAVLIIVFNLTSQEDRDSYMAAANANITKSRKEGLVTNRFEVSQSHLDASTQNILLSLSSLMSNHGAFYEGGALDPDSSEYEQFLYAYIVSLGMIADAYSVLVTGRLGLDDEKFASHLRGVLS